MRSFTRLPALVFSLAAFSPLLSPRLPAQRQPVPTVVQIVSRLNRISARIHSLSAAAVNQNYNSVVGVTDTSSGNLYFRRASSGPWMLLDFRHPARKEFLYRNGIGWIYQPSIHQAQEYNLRHNLAAVQAFLLLGLGESGSQLAHDFKINIQGQPLLNGRRTILLQLVPKDPQAKKSIVRIELWFDPANWIAVQQKYIQTTGDYRLLKFSKIKLNPRLSAKLFSTRFNGAKKIKLKF